MVRLVDLLTHIFLPLILLLSIGLARSKRYLFLLSPLAIFPDLDVFLGIHRGLFHSLLIIMPIVLLSLITLRQYSNYIAFFLGSHLSLDFLAGGVPFLYPIIETGVGIEFPLVVRFSSPPTIVEYLPRIVFTTPTLVQGQSYELFSGIGIALLILFGGIYYARRSKI